MIRELYSSQIEDLASNGYVVATMTHSYDGFLGVAGREFHSVRHG